MVGTRHTPLAVGYRFVAQRLYRSLPFENRVLRRHRQVHKRMFHNYLFFHMLQSIRQHTVPPLYRAIKIKILRHTRRLSHCLFQRPGLRSRAVFRLQLKIPPCGAQRSRPTQSCVHRRPSRYLASHPPRCGFRAAALCRLWYGQ